MHSRAGMATEYLGEEFMSCVRACTEYAKKLGMKANLYDEDRWPSGFAGGYVTEDKNLRQMQICLSLKAPEEFLHTYRDFERNPKFLTAYDIVFDDYDRLANYRVISTDAQAKGEKWYAYQVYKPCCGYHNGYTYADTMKPEAVEKFIAVTHEKYKREIGPLDCWRDIYRRTQLRTHFFESVCAGRRGRVLPLDGKISRTLSGDLQGKYS